MISTASDKGSLIVSPCSETSDLLKIDIVLEKILNHIVLIIFVIMTSISRKMSARPCFVYQTLQSVMLRCTSLLQSDTQEQYFFFVKSSARKCHTHSEVYLASDKENICKVIRKDLLHSFYLRRMKDVCE